MTVVTIHGARPFPASVTIDGVPLTPGPSLALRNHSPDGFSWGYHGSGPAQLALAILLHVVGPELAQRHYQSFKAQHVGSWSQDSDVNEMIDVEGWVANREAADEGWAL